MKNLKPASNPPVVNPPVVNPPVVNPPVENPPVETPVVNFPKTGSSHTIGKGKSKAKYKVLTSSAKGGTVTFVKPQKTNNTKFTVPASVKIGALTYKVTKIEKNAFKNNKKLTSVTIGKNVTSIGANAFWGAQKLNQITIQTKSLKTVGKNALKGISSKCKIKVPKNKLKNYQRLLKGKGQKSGVKITK